MSEQKTTFMASLDELTDSVIFQPLLEDLDLAELNTVQEQIRKAIRAKVLESYRNGQSAGPRKLSRGANAFPVAHAAQG